MYTSPMVLCISNPNCAFIHSQNMGTNVEAFIQFDHNNMEVTVIKISDINGDCDDPRIEAIK